MWKLKKDPSTVHTCVDIKLFLLLFLFCCIPLVMKGIQRDNKTVQFVLEQLSEANKYRLLINSAPVPFHDALTLMKDRDSPLTKTLIKLLQTESSTAYYWECPPINVDTVHSRNFEFVIIRAPSLDQVSVDMRSFLEHFSSSVDSTAAFRSLGGDALLISPVPLEDVDQNTYAHLAVFIRGAPETQVKDFFVAIASSALANLPLSGSNCWLSTSGNGVSYLHARLDSRPKYYNWVEYKDM